ncbi:MAG: extracellular solute-binding protein [Ruminococcaceae bacterium]|nr:extracellular solute-binding protein [Oscillospiraceae bacterium]
MKRTTSILLLMAMLAAVSCGDSGTTADTTASTDSTTTAAPVETGIPEPELPEKDYGGAEFTFLMRGRTASSYKQIYIYTDEQNGEVINDAVYDRNRAVEEKFNIDIQAVEYNKDGEVLKAARQYVMSNDAAIDVINNEAYELGSLAGEAYLVDFSGIPHINLSAEYWDQNAIEQLKIADKLYIMQNDITVNALSLARFIFYNRSLAEEYKLDDPYTLVQENKWTLDTFFGMIQSISSDLNGDGKFDEHDQYGMLSEGGDSNATIIHLLAGCGMMHTTPDADGMPVLNLMNEKVDDIITRTYEAIGNNDYAITYEEMAKTADITGFANVYNYARSLFAGGQFLFVQNGCGTTSQFTNMEDDYGIAPNPKYDESQESYHHKVDKYANMFAVPISAGDLEKVGAVMEYMAWYSNKKLLPAFYEVTLQGKRLRSEHDVEMLELVKNTTFYELADIYNFGTSGIIWAAFQKGGNLSSVYASKAPAVETKIDKLIEAFSELE